MTRRLGGIGRRSLTALASLSLAGTLACGFAITGCGGDNSSADSGLPDTGPDVVVDTGVDTGIDTGKPDTGSAMDSNVPVPVVDAGPPCATPTFAPGMGTVAAGTSVTVTSAGLPGSGLIYFTTDGTQPTHSSRALAPGGTIVVTQSEAVKAVAFAQGVCTDSALAQADYTVPPPPDTGAPVPDSGPALMPCPTPSFAPATGTALMSGQNVVITATGLPTGGVIFFTTDNSFAGRTSPMYNGGSVGVQVPQGETIHAISSTLGATCLDSAQAVATYTVTAPPLPDAGPGTPPAVPTFAPTGALATQSNEFAVTLTDTTQTAIICYTIGATGAAAAPKCTTTASTAVCSGGTLTYSAALTVNGSVTTAGQVEVDAIACVPGAAQSAAGKSLYTLQAATPTMTPAAGMYSYATGLTGSFLSATSGATIFYTINGAAPSCTTPVAGQLTYAGAFPLQGGSYQAIACKTGYLPSAVSAASAITVNLTAPVVTPAAGTYSTALNAAVANSAANPTSSWLCSTVTGAGATASTPVCGTATGTCTTGTAGTTPPAVANGGTLAAIACAPAGFSNSTVTTVGPYGLALGTPAINPNGAGATVGSYLVPGGGIMSLTVADPAGDVASGWFCFMKDAQFAGGTVCGAAANTCAQGTFTASDLKPGMLTYAAGDFVSVVACPGLTGASAGYTAAGPVTLSFISTGTSISPTVTPAGGTSNTIVTPVVANTNGTAATLCYTTDNTTPACTPGSGAATCNTVTGTAIETMSVQITSAGTGYVNPPTVSFNNAGTGGSCTGTPVATLTGSGIATVTVTGCSGYIASPVVSFLPGSLGGVTISPTVTETIAVAVTNPGAGYTSAPTVSIKAPGSTTELCGAGGVTCTATLGTAARAGQVISVAVTGWSGLHGVAPNVTFTGGAGAGAAATAATTQTIAFAPSAGSFGAGVGSNYTVAPAVTLTGGAGACATPVATLGTGATAGKIISLVATGCSGFTGTPTVAVALQGPANGTANAATAVAVASSMWALPAMQTATTLKVASCGTGLTQSSTVSNAYAFTVANPTITTVTTGAGDQSGTLGTPGTTGGPLTAANALTIATTSNFTGEFLVYNLSGAVPVACTGAGASSINGAVTVPGNTVTLTPAQLPTNGGATITVRAIACGTTQTNSAGRALTVTNGVGVAYPYIDTVANGTDVSILTGPNPSRTQGTLTLNNVATATITNPTTTAGSFLCYTTNGVNPNGACTCSAMGETKVTAATATVNVTQTNTTLKAIACALEADGMTLVSSLMSSATYVLQLTPPALTASATLACPAAYTLDMDPSQASSDGPTAATVTTCYGLNQPVACTGAQPAGVTCVTATPAAISFSGDTAGTSLFVLQCSAGFPNQASTLTINPLLPYTPPMVVVDGVLGEWGTVPTSASLAAGTTGSLTGGLTFNLPVTDLFVATGGVTLGAGKGLVVYLSSNLSPGANTTTTSETGTATLPFAAEYAIVVPLTATCAANGGGMGQCPVTGFKFGGGAWAANAGIVSAVSGVQVTATAVELDIVPAGTDLANATTVSSAGAVFTGSGGAAVLNGEWPSLAGAWNSFHTTINSCVTPVASIQ